MREDRLEAGDGLTLAWRDGTLRVDWRGLDWWGPIDALTSARSGALRVEACFEGRDDLGAFTGWRVDPTGGNPRLELSVRAYAALPLLVFRTAARESIGGLATGAFDTPCVGWPCLAPGRRERAGWPADASVFGHQYTEFALPTFSDADCAGFFLLPGRPAVVEPLWMRAGEHTLMLAPLDGFHEQVIAVPRDATLAASGVRCGWHGDLEHVDAAFATELALWGGRGVRDTAERWGALLLERQRTRRRGRYADVAVGLLSYWTDNGSAYWYRTEPGHDVPGTLVAALESLRKARVPVTALELDSWFYSHEVPRAFDDVRTDVPPSGALVWEPRPDVLPAGIEALRASLGRPPLILHGRHFSSRSPYFERHGAWTDADRGHPSGPALFDTLMAQARRWGAVQYEQDWLVECFLGVRGLRERAGRARRWQEDLDRSAEKNGLSLLWCMGTPADFFQTVSLRALGAIRTSGDYRYRIGSESLWCWFLYGNALARALGLLPFKDVFVSDPRGDGRDGDPHAELEAALAALSAGPVGLGDRTGHTSRAVVMRTCREDGQLVKPDVPIAALDRCFRRHAHLWPDPLLAETWSQHAAGRWVYALSVHASRAYGDIDVTLPLCELPLDPAVRSWIVWDWRTETLARIEPSATLCYSLAPRAWRLHVLCPVLSGGVALIGDPTKYACVGDARIHRIESANGVISFDALGVAGELVRIEGWSADGLPTAECWTPSASMPLEVEASVSGPGGFRLAVPIAERGWTHVRVVC